MQRLSLEKEQALELAQQKEAEATREVEQLRSELTSSQSDVQRLSSEKVQALELSRQRETETTLELNEVRTQLAVSEAEMRALRIRFQELSERSSDETTLETVLSEFSATIKHLDQELSDSIEEIVVFETKTYDAIQEMSIARSSEKTKETDELIATIRSQLHQAEKENRAIVRKLESRDEKCSALMAVKRELSKDLKIAHKKIQTLHAARDEAVSLAQNLELVASRQTAELEQGREFLARRDAESKKLKAELEASASRESELVAALSDSSSSEAELQKIIEEFKVTELDLVKQIENLQDHSDGLAIALKKETSQSVNFREWSGIVESRLAYKTSEVDALRSSLSWKVTSPLRQFGSLFVRAGEATQPMNSAITSDPLPAPVTEDHEPLQSTADAILIPVSKNPRVSIIIPVYGQIEFTLQCLRSIQKYPPVSEFEVIVVDDKSPDNTTEILQNIAGLNLIKNEVNLGFIGSVNAGADQAIGDYLFILNNDTEIQEGSIDYLLDSFEQIPNLGLVGSKLIYPDGRLQEAGGIIWNDGTAWNFGRMQDPELPEFNYARSVDYCSGASIMITRDLFLELGGFDEHYAPAYCEDADLALKIRSRGLEVYYQPASVVIHYEGVTSGTDVEGEGVKRYQVENSKKMYLRWQETLSNYQNNGADLDIAKDRDKRARVLILDHCTPTPDQDAGSVTIFNMMMLFRDLGYQVTFIPEDNFLYMPAYTPQLQRRGIEVLYAPKHVSVEEHLKIDGHRYDLVFLVRPRTVKKHLQSVIRYAPQARTLFHTIDLHYLRMEREASLSNCDESFSAAAVMKIDEMAAMNNVDATIVHSEKELDILQEEEVA